MTSVLTRNVRFEAGPRPRLGSLVLARPDRGNAIDRAFADDLLAAVRAANRAAHDGDIDCLAVTAEGSAFCVGGDLQDFPSDPAAATTHLHAMSTVSHKALRLLHELPVPVVTRVQGAAAGAGLGLAAVGDVVIASTAARFVGGYGAVALSPDCGVTWLLPRLVGDRRTFQLLLNNYRLEAMEAQQWGLVSSVVSPEDLDGAVDAAVQAVLAAGPAARETKRLIRSSPATSLQSHLADEGSTIAALGASDAAIAARTAFLTRSRADRPEKP